MAGVSVPVMPETIIVLAHRDTWAADRGLLALSAPRGRTYKGNRSRARRLGPLGGKNRRCDAVGPQTTFQGEGIS